MTELFWRRPWWLALAAGSAVQRGSSQAGRRGRSIERDGASSLFPRGSGCESASPFALLLEGFDGSLEAVLLPEGRVLIDGGQEDGNKTQ